MPRGNMKRRGLLPAELRRKRRRLFFWKIGAYAFGVLLLVVGVGFAARLDALQIATVYVDGAMTAGEGSVRTLVEGQLAGSYAFLFPRNNTFLISKSDITQAIHEHIPIIEAVSIHRRGLTGLSIGVEEREARAEWCAGKNDEASTTTPAGAAEGCYFTDASGFIFSQSRFVWSEAGSSTPRLVRFVMPLALTDGGDTPIGHHVLTPEEFAPLLTLTDDMRDMGLAVREIHQLGEDDVEVLFGDGLRAYLPTGPALPEALNNLVLVISSDIFAGDASVDYIDVRFGNKVYYKENASPANE